MYIQISLVNGHLSYAASLFLALCSTLPLKTICPKWPSEQKKTTYQPKVPANIQTDVFHRLEGFLFWNDLRTKSQYDFHYKQNVMKKNNVNLTIVDTNFNISNKN
jgi:hypothetical protein